MSEYLKKAAEQLGEAAKKANDIFDHKVVANLRLDIAREYAKLAAIEKGSLPAPTVATDDEWGSLR